MDHNLAFVGVFGGLGSNGHLNFVTDHRLLICNECYHKEQLQGMVKELKLAK
jgi:hypothetical protein